MAEEKCGISGLPCEPGARRVPLCAGGQGRTLPPKSVPPNEQDRREPPGTCRSRSEPHRTPPNPPLENILGFGPGVTLMSRSPHPEGRGMNPRDTPERGNVRDDFYVFLILFYFY